MPRTPFAIRVRKLQSRRWRSEEHTSELQSQSNLVCRLLLEKKKKNNAAHRALCTGQSEYSPQLPCHLPNHEASLIFRAQSTSGPHLSSSVVRSDRIVSLDR